MKVVFVRILLTHFTLGRRTSSTQSRQNWSKKMTWSLYWCFCKKMKLNCFVDWFLFNKRVCLRPIFSCKTTKKTFMRWLFRMCKNVVNVGLHGGTGMLQPTGTFTEHDSANQSTDCAGLFVRSYDATWLVWSMPSGSRLERMCHVLSGVRLLLLPSPGLVWRCGTGKEGTGFLLSARSFLLDRWLLHFQF